VRYFTSPEVPAVLGLSRDAYGSLTRRAVHDPGTAPAWWLPPDVPGGGGLAHRWTQPTVDKMAAAYADYAPWADDVDLLGEDPSSLPDTFRVGMRQLAHLRGVSYAYIRAQRSDGDLPEADGYEGPSPWWYLETLRNAGQAGTATSIEEER